MPTPPQDDEAVYTEAADRLRLVIAVRPVFRGGRTWLVGPNDGSAFSTGARDPGLIKALRRAHAHAREHGIAP